MVEVCYGTSLHSTVKTVHFSHSLLICCTYNSTQHYYRYCISPSLLPPLLPQSYNIVTASSTPHQHPLTCTPHTSTPHTSTPLTITPHTSTPHTITSHQYSTHHHFTPVLHTPSLHTSTPHTITSHQYSTHHDSSHNYSTHYHSSYHYSTHQYTSPLSVPLQVSYRPS